MVYINILFIVLDFYPNFDANSIIVYNLAKEIQKNGDHRVYIISVTPSPHLATEETWAGIKIYRVDKILGKKLLKEEIAAGKIYSAFKIFLEVAKNRLIHLYGRLVFYDTFFSKPLIEKVIQQDAIDVVIPVCYPFTTNHPVMQLKKERKLKCKWLTYMQDPYFSHQYSQSQNANKNERVLKMQFEDEVLSYADAAIVTDLLYEDYTKCMLKRHLYKANILPFPKVVEPIDVKDPEDICFDRQFINCVFIGRFNMDIRNPGYLFSLFSLLKNKTIKLHIVGSNSYQLIDECKIKLGDRLEIHGQVSRQAALNAIIHGDILINVGNAVPNQLPSKLLEYISVGKPIVNFYKLNNCPTLQYLERYPICLNISERNIINAEVVERFENFCIDNYGRQIDYGVIKELYSDCTAEVVAKQFMDIIYKL